MKMERLFFVIFHPPDKRHPDAGRDPDKHQFGKNYALYNSQ